MDDLSDDVIPTRATLLARLKDWGDNKSWQDFFDTYWNLIYRVGIKAGLRKTEAEDLVQEVMISVAKHMPAFKYNPQIGSFKAWLLRMTRWRIIDQLRKRGPTSARSIETLIDPRGEALESFWENEWRQNLLSVATSKVKQRCDPAKYQIFDLHVNKNWPPERLAATFGVRVAQVYLIKHRLSKLIRSEVEHLEAEMM